MIATKKQLTLFVGMTYLVFIVLFLITGMTQTFITQNKAVITTLSHLCAWSSFFVIMFGFKKFCPNQTRCDFFKGLFAEKFDVKIGGALFLTGTAIFLVCLICSSLYQKVSVSSCLNMPSLSLCLAFLIELCNGPVGEEFGWRGYYLTQKSHSAGILKASLMNGLLWGLNHVPLWFINGFHGTSLLIYIFSFLVSIICCNVVMGYVFLKHRNLLYPIILHFLNNFYLGCLYTGDFVTAMVFNAVCYCLTAVGFVLYHELFCAKKTN